jgi:hypothetical protein
MIYRRNLEGELEFLVIDTVSTDQETGRKSPKQTKFPGGMNRIPGNEPIDVTGKREVLEETYLAFIKWEKVWEKQVNKEHAKYGLLVCYEDCRGELRQDVLIDNGDEMSPPYWASVSTLKFTLFSGHQPPFLEALKYLGVP